MKKLIVAGVLLALLLSALVLAGCGEKKVPAGAIAAVGDGVVTQQQFDDIWAQAEAQYKSQPGAPPFPKEGTPEYDQLKASIVNYLVLNELAKQEAADMGVTVPQKDFDERIKLITQQVGGQKKLDQLLKQQGVTMQQLRDQLQSQMLQDALRKKIGEESKPTAEQIKAYFNDPKNKHQFETPESVNARHVLLKSKAAALKVQKLLEADNTDVGWKKIAKRYSTDPGTKGKGGDLGNFPKGRMVAPFDKVAFTIKAGTVSAPFKTQFGWHVLEVTQKVPASKRTLDEAKSQIEQTLTLSGEGKAWETWLKNAQKEAGIVYAPGFNPAQLTASPSPAGSAPPASGAPSPSASPSP